jgi:hypothetical protein
MFRARQARGILGAQNGGGWYGLGKLGVKTKPGGPELPADAQNPRENAHGIHLHC